MAPKRSRSRSASASVAAPPEGADDLPGPSTAPPPPPSRAPAFYDSSDDSEEHEYLPMGREYVLGSDDESGPELDLDEPPSTARTRKQAALGSSAFEWRRQENIPKKIEFSAQPGVNVDALHRESTPFEIFSHFVTPKLLDQLVRQTNEYFRESRPSSPSRSWCNTSRGELCAYFGLRLLMLMQPTPSVESYFEDPLCSVQAFHQTMSLKRFLILTDNLHAVDNREEHPAHDRLWKLRPVLQVLARQFSTVYTPPQGLTVDECMWRFRRDGDVLGVKAYRLCVRDGSTPGYTSAFGIYAGEAEGDLPSPGRVVVDLMAAAGLFDKGYELFTDLWYTSPALFRLLQGRLTNAVGTVRSDRKNMPSNLKTRGEVAFCSTPTGLLCLQWRAKTMLSTVHDSGISADKSRPKAVSDYIVGMHRVRRGDPLARSCPPVRESVSWYKRVLFYLLNLATVNAFCVHRALGGRMTRFQFRTHLIRDLIGRNEPPKYSGYSEEEEEEEEEDQHFRTVLDYYRRCRICDLQGKSKMTRSRCYRCGVPLCKPECFREWHSHWYYV